MRQRPAPSAIVQLAAPLATWGSAAWQRMHWLVAAMALLYAASGVCVIHADEVAVILHWGGLVGSTPALQQHGPGLLFAFPQPIDEVVRVPIKRLWTLPVTTLAAVEQGSRWVTSGTLDPVTTGYALTGDRNILHVDMVAHYRSRDPVEWLFHAPESERLVQLEVATAMVQSLGEVGVDNVLAAGRERLIAVAKRRAQDSLDAVHAGIELASLELTRLGPPRALAGEFDAVQSAFIAAETSKQEALAFAQGVVPKARAEAEAAIQSARAAATVDLAQARGEAAAFLALEREYRADPATVRERLYRDAVEAALGKAEVRWIPAPVGSTKAETLRVSIRASKAQSHAEPSPVDAANAKTAEKLQP